MKTLLFVLMIAGCGTEQVKTKSPFSGLDSSKESTAKPVQDEPEESEGTSVKSPFSNLDK